MAQAAAGADRAAADELLGYGEAVAKALDGRTAEIDFCREKLALPAAELNPPPLITGEDLKRLGIPPGPAYRPLLETVRDAQLERLILSQGEALALAQRLLASVSQPDGGQEEA